MKLKIISDGTIWGTKVVNAETNDLVENVISAEWSVDASSGIATAELKVMFVEVDIMGDFEIERVPLTEL